MLESKIYGDTGENEGVILWTVNGNGNDNDEGNDESDGNVLSFCFVSNLKVSRALFYKKKVNTPITVENKSGGIGGGNNGHDITSAVCYDDYTFIKILDIFGLNRLKIIRLNNFV